MHHINIYNILFTTTKDRKVLRIYSYLGLFPTVSYLLKALHLFPLLKKTHGTGKSATAINPSKLEAHSVPSLLYTIQHVRIYFSVSP